MSDYSESDIQEFVVEAYELLEVAEADLLNAERGQSTTFYDSAIRAFHSLKGGAGMLGLNALQSHMHKVETLWITLKGKTILTKSESEYFLAAIDGARKILQGETITFDYSGPQSEVPPPTATIAAVAEPLKQTTPPPDARPLQNQSRGLVYAIDDENSILVVLKDLLEENSFQVECFTDSAALLQRLQEAEPNVLLTDFKMPEKTGLEILREARKMRSDVPVIMASGFLTKEILIESLRDGGFYGAIEKPFKNTDLINTVWSACRHHENKKIIRKAINLLMYQFTDLEQYLVSQGKADIAKTIGSELKELLARQRALA